MNLPRREFLATLATLPALPAAAAPATSAVKDIENIRALTAKAKTLRATVRSSAGNRRNLPLDPTPGVNNYASTTDAVVRAKKSVLVPLQAAMAAAAGTATGLSDEQQKQLALQPQIMTGHMSEVPSARHVPYASPRLILWPLIPYISQLHLTYISPISHLVASHLTYISRMAPLLPRVCQLDYYLKKLSFEQYTSKTTGDTYPGGKVERELEEVCETADDFINLAYGRAVQTRVD